jgi:hypothetical protein
LSSRAVLNYITLGQPMNIGGFASTRLDLTSRSMLHNQFPFPTISWRDTAILGALIGAPIATDYAAPEYAGVVIPLSAALLIIYGQLAGGDCAV